MSALTRRELFRSAGGGFAALAAGAGTAVAAGSGTAPGEAVGLLYDTTLCIGCQACVVGCSEANDMPRDTRDSDGLWQTPRDLNSRTLNVIQLFRETGGGGYSFMKKQCMHCLDPACVSGCPFHALKKDERTGVVTWTGSRCIGCRYCEVSCPFGVPKFEWDRFNPKITKCQLCDHRLREGQEPGCTEACPTGAVVFGKRSDLLVEAKRRVGSSPGKYHEERVYGEHDGGGTQCLYLSHVPFEKIGLPKLGRRSVPERANVIYQWFTKYALVPVGLYALFVSFLRRNWKHHDAEAKRLEEQAGLRDQL